jgi:hypothetical protein
MAWCTQTFRNYRQGCRCVLQTDNSAVRDSVFRADFQLFPSHPQNNCSCLQILIQWRLVVIWKSFRSQCLMESNYDEIQVSLERA